ncbi:glycosyltransferase family 4 protein [Streptomyces sp. YIM 98790]|uniref:glycosyltransferase family 4 protein n=1 Tax=Streptomyces sp. YIM 98790 TaxID=2689077 RepID=UPI00140CB5BD|nr:glycosyltransferase family 4 protein [Streptomyces sp. YIM 98790]
MRIRYLLLHAYGVGGTIRTVFTQANALAAAGHEIEVVSVVRARARPRFALDPRVRLTPLTDLRAEPAPVPLGPLARRRLPRGARAAARPMRYVPRGEAGLRQYHRGVEQRVTGYLRGLRDGILVTTRPGLNLLSARFATGGVVRVAQEHRNLAGHPGDTRAAIIRHYPACDAVVVLTGQDLADYRAMLPRARVEHIPNAVHSLRLTPADGSARVVVAAGRLRRQKGFDLLIPAFARAAARHPDWELRIFGAGEDEPVLRALTARHGMAGRIRLPGTSHRLDEELSRASVYVLSSRYEGLPMVLLEAMAHALPVVSFDCPTGPAEVLTHGLDGLLAEPENPAALGDALAALMADEDLRADMGDAALTTARAYSPQAVAGRWTALFEDLLADRARRPAPAPAA